MSTWPTLAFHEADRMLSELLQLTGLTVGNDITRYAAFAAGMTDDEFAVEFEWAMDCLDAQD